MYVCMSVCVCTCMHAWMDVCMDVCMYNRPLLQTICSTSAEDMGFRVLAPNSTYPEGPRTRQVSE